MTEARVIVWSIVGAWAGYIASAAVEWELAVVAFVAALGGAHRFLAALADLFGRRS